MWNPPRPTLAVEQFKALGNEHRLGIMHFLGGGVTASVGELAAALGSSAAMTSQHLGVLKRAGLVEKERTGRYVVYRISPAACGGLGVLCRSEFDTVTLEMREEQPDENQQENSNSNG